MSLFSIHFSNIRILYVSVCFPLYLPLTLFPFTFYFSFYSIFPPISYPLLCPFPHLPYRILALFLPSPFISFSSSSLNPITHTQFLPTLNNYISSTTTYNNHLQPIKPSPYLSLIIVALQDLATRPISTIVPTYNSLTHHFSFSFPLRPPDHRMSGYKVSLHSKWAETNLNTPLRHWSHFCFTYAHGSASWRIFLDGERQAEGSLPKEPGPLEPNGAYVIGTVLCLACVRY